MVFDTNLYFTTYFLIPVRSLVLPQAPLVRVLSSVSKMAEKVCDTIDIIFSVISPTNSSFRFLDGFKGIGEEAFTGESEWSCGPELKYTVPPVIWMAGGGFFWNVLEGEGASG